VLAPLENNISPAHTRRRAPTAAMPMMVSRESFMNPMLPFLPVRIVILS
jgi:hypothetical protein